MIIAETQVDDQQFRISKLDYQNIILEKYNPPHIAEKGPKKGEMTEGRWVVLGYYGTAQKAARAIVTQGVFTIPGEFSEVIETLNKLEAAFESKV